MGNKKHRPDDQTLLLELSEGSEQAFRVIYERYQGGIYRTAYRFLQTPDLAEDVVQEVFSSVWTHRYEFSEVRNLDAFIKTIARNAIYSALRKLSYEQRNISTYSYTVNDSIEDTDFNLQDTENQQLLNQIINSLPGRQQEIFYLSRHEGLSHEHIAQKLNISPGTVKNHLVRALQTIREQLAPHIEGSSLTLIFCTTHPLADFF